MESPHVREYKIVLDSGFHTDGLRIAGTGLDSSLCQWNLDSNLQWDSGFLEQYSGFQSPLFRIQYKEIFPGLRIPYMGYRRARALTFKANI